MRETIRRKLLKARTALVLDHPFFGSLCLRMTPEEDSTCRTAWTDGRTLAYNPAYVDSLEPDALCGLLAHTVMHPACQHHTRRKGRDHDLWNMACDHAINWLLLDAGLNLPVGYLDNPAYHGLNADEIYAALASAESGDGPGELGESGDGPEQGDAAPEQAGSSHGEEGSGDEVSGSGGQGEQDGGPDSGDDGEAENSKDPGMSGDPGGSGEVRDADNEDGSGSPRGQEKADEEWRMALAEAAQQARDMGKLPGGLERLVKSVLSPRLDWRELLDRFIRDRARNDYAWTPPSRRHLHMGLYFPSLAQEALPEVVLALDTSGSVTAHDLEQFAAELSAILEQYDTTLRILYCDREIMGEQTVRREDLPLSLKACGGGGTDFRPVFRHVEETGMAPACLVYLTDMVSTCFPENIPPYPVLWARIGGGGRIPPFGNVIDIVQ